MKNSSTIRTLYGGDGGNIILEDLGDSISIEWSDGYTLNAYGSDADSIMGDWFTCQHNDVWTVFNNEYREIADPPEGH